MAQVAIWTGDPSPDRWPGDLGLPETDPELAAVLAQERQRARRQLSLLASESISGRAAREAEDVVLARRYAEGLPGARLAGGCDHLNTVEEIARRRACALFGAEYANVQPHSGTAALMAAYQALCRPGDTILALDPGCGGHFAHGSPASLAGRLYRFVHYAVRRDTGRIDPDEVQAVARRERPTLLVAGASAYPRAMDFPAFASIAASVGARLLVDMAHLGGLVAAGLHPNPVPWADVVVAATHKTLCGPRGGMVLCRGACARAVDRAVFPGIQGAAQMQSVAAKAVCLLAAAGPEFAAYQRRVVRNAAALAAALTSCGLHLVTGGTDTHLLVVDLRALGLSGRQAERALAAAGILCNRQPVPFDPLPPVRSSGIRFGTTVVTARGMDQPEMREIAAISAAVLTAAEAGRQACDAVAASAALQVAELAGRFPLPE